MKYFSILCLFVFSWGMSNAQNVGITATTDTNIILIGQQVKVTVSITAKEKDLLSFPILSDSLASNVEIVDQTEWDTTVSADLYNFSKVVSVTSWDSGFYPIPPIPAVINSDTFSTEAFLIAVATIPIDSTNAIADIKGIETDPLTWRDYLDAYGKYILWIWLAALLIGLILFGILRYKKKPEEHIEVKPSIPPHIVALGKLKTLESEKLWQNNQVKAYHVQLSEIIREYLEHRYKIPALEQTTEVIMHYLRLSDISEDQKISLRKLLALTDLVKFAKETPLAKENEDALKSAFELVEATKLVTEEKEQEKPVEDA